MSEQHPKTIGPFEVIEVIAEGGMATVYKGIQPSLERTVAIKVLSLSLAEDDDLLARFERESVTIAKLSHPNIIQVIDRGEADGRYFIVMEFVEGHGLDELIRAGQLSVYQAVSIAIQVARAIEHAHARGIIHRDIKPANVLISSESGTVKVTDFGIAHIAEQQASRRTLTQAQISMGTVDYMSPEQRRDARSVDERSDVFSFGVMLYEMLTGRLPVGRFRDLHDVRDDTPPLLNHIVLRCLHEEPSDRYPSFEQLLTDLKKLSEKELVYREALVKAAHTVLKVPHKARTAITKRTARLFTLDSLSLASLRKWGLLGLIVLAVLVAGGLSLQRLGRGGLPSSSSRPPERGGLPPAAQEEDKPTPEPMAEKMDYGEEFARAEESYARQRWDSALDVLRRIRTEGRERGDRKQAAEAQWRIGLVHEARDDVSSAAVSFAYFVDEYAEEGKKRLPEALFKAGIYKARDWDVAAGVGYLKRIREEFPSHEIAAEALYREAVNREENLDPAGNGKTAHWRTVASLYENLLENHKDSPHREDCWWRWARLHQDKREIRDYRRTVGILERMAAEFPQSNREPLFKAADIARVDLDDSALARRLYQAFIEAQPNSSGVQDAQFWLERL